jgi:hypothetical protein
MMNKLDDAVFLRNELTMLQTTIKQLTAECDAFAAENDAIHRAVNELCGTNTSTIEAVAALARQLKEARPFALYVCTNEPSTSEMFQSAHAWLTAAAGQGEAKA